MMYKEKLLYQAVLASAEGRPKGFHHRKLKKGMYSEG